MRRLPVMEHYKRVTTSYCQYGFPYCKPTDFWYYGFNLNLTSRCTPSNPCPYYSSYGYHQVVIGYRPKPHKRFQQYDVKYWRQVRRTDPTVKNWSDQFFRYRIPPLLLKDVKSSVEASF